jgi:hypothetical protein
MAKDKKNKMTSNGRQNATHSNQLIPKKNDIDEKHTKCVALKQTY